MNIRTLALLLIALLQVVVGSACDMCNGGAAGYYMGVLPQYKGHFIGLRTQTQQFTIQHPSVFINESPERATTTYSTTELFGRIALHKQFQLIGRLPYQAVKQIEADSTLKNNGIGDAELSALFIVLNTGDSLTKTIRQYLAINAGIKAPTGRYHSQFVTDGIANMQTGTRSWDVPLGIIYTIRRNKIGWSAEGRYRYNTTNKYAYHYGNRTQVSQRFFYWKQAGAFSLVPQAGLSYEYNRPDSQKNRLLLKAGNSATMGLMAFDVYYRSYSAGISCMVPLALQTAAGTLTSTPRIAFQVLYLF